MFKTPLDVRYVDGRNWRLLRDLLWESPTGGYIIIPAGFITDFASVPRFFWRLVPPAGSGKHGAYGPASVVHDYLYRTKQYRGARIRRFFADAIFREIMTEYDVEGWRKWVMWASVRLLGWSSWRR